MSISQQHHARDCLVAGLRRQLNRWEAGRPAGEAARFSSGAAAIDRLLPGGGLCYGMLVEWLGDCGLGNAECGMSCSIRTPHSAFRNSPSGSGAATLSIVSAREACRAGGVLVVIDRRQMFYPPAAAAWGVDPARLIVVHPRDRRDELWAAVQSLRSPAVAAVWAMIDRLDERAFRRLQLAAQAGCTLGLLLRPASVRDQPSWADVRLGVGMEQGAKGYERAGSSSTPEDRKLQIFNPPSALRLPSSSDSRLLTLDSQLSCVRVLRTRRGRPGSAAILEIDDAAHVVREVVPNDDANPLPVAAELADPTAHPRPARA